MTPEDAVTLDDLRRRINEIDDATARRSSPSAST